MSDKLIPTTLDNPDNRVNIEFRTYVTVDNAVAKLAGWHINYPASISINDKLAAYPGYRVANLGAMAGMKPYITFVIEKSCHVDAITTVAEPLDAIKKIVIDECNFILDRAAAEEANYQASKS